jgi:hypothetical protein
MSDGLDRHPTADGSFATNKIDQLFARQSSGASAGSGCGLARAKRPRFDHVVHGAKRLAIRSCTLRFGVSITAVTEHPKARLINC